MDNQCCLLVYGVLPGRCKVEESTREVPNLAIWVLLLLGGCGASLRVTVETFKVAHYGVFHN